MRVIQETSVICIQVSAGKIKLYFFIPCLKITVAKNCIVYELIESLQIQKMKIILVNYLIFDNGKELQFL